MALILPGTNDYAANVGGISGISTQDTFALGLFLYVPTDPVGLQTVLDLYDSAGASSCKLRVDAPAAAGFKLNVWQDYDTTDGEWEYGDLTCGEWHYVGIDVFTLGNPWFYYDTTSVGTGTTLVAPAGAAVKTKDSIRIGENAAGGEDFTGRVCELGLWTTSLSLVHTTTIRKGGPGMRSTDRALWWPAFDAREIDQAADLTLSGDAYYNGENPIYRRHSANKVARRQIGGGPIQHIERAFRLQLGR
jgi:hypothetical protein